MSTWRTFLSNSYFYLLVFHQNLLKRSRSFEDQDQGYSISRTNLFSLLACDGTRLTEKHSRSMLFVSKNKTT